MSGGIPGIGRHDVALLCHPDNANRWVRGISVGVDVGRNGALAFAFLLDADLARLRVPKAVLPRRADRLWEHTCFEAFVAPRGQAVYHEFNFSPSGEWAAYAFRGYRDGAMLDRDLAPAIAVRRRADALELEAFVGAECLPHAPRGARFQIALTAVIEDEAGTFSHWAISHPGSRPDFHHRGGFKLEIDALHNSGIDPPLQCNTI
jgi:hypothetical protein